MVRRDIGFSRLDRFSAFQPTKPNTICDGGVHSPGTVGTGVPPMTVARSDALSPQPGHRIGNEPIADRLGKWTLVAWRTGRWVFRSDVLLRKGVVHDGVGLLAVHRTGRGKQTSASATRNAGNRQRRHDAHGDRGDLATHFRFLFVVLDQPQGDLTAGERFETTKSRTAPPRRVWTNRSDGDL